MKAKEMFEELGFERIKNNNKKIVYKSKGYKKIIIDLKKNKLFVKTNVILINRFANVTELELQAINKQLEELGWNK